METTLLYDQLKSALANTQTLQEAEEILQKEIEKVSHNTIGFVVGKVTPSGNQTKESNLLLLEKRTKEIAEKELSKGIVVFSSSVIPKFIEDSTEIDMFYTFWEHTVEKYAQILYTTPGYESSKGATNEITLARKMGKEVKSYEEVIGHKS